MLYLWAKAGHNTTEGTRYEVRNHAWNLNYCGRHSNQTHEWLRGEIWWSTSFSEFDGNHKWIIASVCVGGGYICPEARELAKERIAEMVLIKMELD